MTTTVAQAVAEREAAPAKPSLAVVAVDAIRGQFDRFKLVMPSNMDPDRFDNLMVGLVKRDPKLIACFATPAGKASLILAALECASLGLEPNTPLKEASIVPRKNKGVDEAQLMVEYRGLIKLARRSGELSTIRAEVVYERDEFEYELGLDPVLRHRPYEGDDDPGELTHCYAVAVFKDGGQQFVVVPRRVVHNEHRAKSDSWRNERSRPYSPWTVFPAAMWRKTAVRCLEPFLPLTAEAARAIDAIEARTFHIDGDAIVPASYGSQATGTDDVIDISTGEIMPAPDAPSPELPGVS